MRLPGEAEALSIPNPRQGVVPGVRDPSAIALANAGQKVVSAADDMYSAVQRSRNYLSDVSAESAYNDLTNDAIDLAEGEDGYKRVQGEDVLGKEFVTGYSERLKKRYEERVSNLDPQTREKVRQRYDILATKFREDIFRHQISETDRHNNEVFETTIDTAVRMSGVDYENPAAVAANLVRIYASIDRFAEQEGKSQEWVKARKAIHEGEVVETVMVSTLANDPYKAVRVLSKPVESLDEGKRLTLLRSAYAEINRREEQSNKFAAKRLENGQKEATLLYLRGELTPDKLAEMREQDLIPDSYVFKMEERAHMEGPVFDDPGNLFDYQWHPLDYSEETIIFDPTLTTATKNSLIAKRRELEEDAENWRRTQNGQEAVRMIEETFGIVKGIMAQINPELQQRANLMLQELYSRVEELPLQKREREVINVANELIAKETKIDSKKREQVLRDRKLNDLQYQTVEEVNKAFEETKDKWFGGMTEEERDEHIRLIQDYDSRIESARESGK